MCRPGDGINSVGQLITRGTLLPAPRPPGVASVTSCVVLNATGNATGLGGITGAGNIAGIAPGQVVGVAVQLAIPGWCEPQSWCRHAHACV